MIVTATEFKKNIGKFLALSEKEDIYITKNGRNVARLTNPNADRIEMAKSLFGILPPSVSLEEAKEGRISKHERLD